MSGKSRIVCYSPCECDHQNELDKTGDCGQLDCVYRFYFDEDEDVDAEEGNA